MILAKSLRPSSRSAGWWKSVIEEVVIPKIAFVHGLACRISDPDTENLCHIRARGRGFALHHLVQVICSRDGAFQRGPFAFESSVGSRRFAESSKSKQFSSSNCARASKSVPWLLHYGVAGCLSAIFFVRAPHVERNFRFWPWRGAAMSRHPGKGIAHGQLQ